MARKVITVLTDDLDGGKADRTVEFSLDGVAYTIDVSDENAGVLRKTLDPYINAGRRIGRGPVESARSVRRPGRPAGAGRRCWPKPRHQWPSVLRRPRSPPWPISDADRS
ncbi:Lsr2 family protein, partial [Micromonospora sp. NPDC005324]|uniref:histone-like nucleoid-structuring protein Lsr2 n=1 Tax=Micromonospora sp. NPDC005324 TaxID=3157033 RepID=UPI0033AED7FA